MPREGVGNSCTLAMPLQNKVVAKDRDPVSILNIYDPSVANPVCLSRISDPKTASKEKGGKEFVLPFFVATNITKCKII
jgi:hypothetical protein